CVFCSFFGWARSSGEVVLIKAIIWLSGDHRGELAPLGRSVTFQASPPVIGSRKSCGAGGLAPAPAPAPGVPAGGSGARRKTSHLPSGDHRGEESWLPLVMRRGASSPPSETLQSEVSYPSFFSLTLTFTNATREPSGEICGSPIQLNWKRSFSVMERFCANARKAMPRQSGTTIKRRRTCMRGSLSD